jgi:hypothetical protein
LLLLLLLLLILRMSGVEWPTEAVTKKGDLAMCDAPKRLTVQSAVAREARVCGRLR